MANILQETIESLMHDFDVAKDPWLKSLEEAIAEAAQDEAEIVEDIKEVIEGEKEADEKVEEITEIIADIKEDMEEEKEEEVEAAVEIAEEACAIKLIEFNLMCMEAQMNSMSTEEAESDAGKAKNRSFIQNVVEFIKKIARHITNIVGNVAKQFQIWMVQTGSKAVAAAEGKEIPAEIGDQPMAISALVGTNDSGTPVKATKPADSIVLFKDIEGGVKAEAIEGVKISDFKEYSTWGKVENLNPIFAAIKEIQKEVEKLAQATNETDAEKIKMAQKSAKNAMTIINTGFSAVMRNAKSVVAAAGKINKGVKAAEKPAAAPADKK